MTWHVYILECADGTFYTGVTNDLAARLARHAAGKGAKYTRGRGPLILRHSEKAKNKSAALKREAAIKSLNRQEKRALITGKMPMHARIHEKERPSNAQ